MFFFWFIIFCFAVLAGFPFLLEAWDEHKERELKLKVERLKYEKELQKHTADSAMWKVPSSMLDK